MRLGPDKPTKKARRRVVLAGSSTNPYLLYHSQLLPTSSHRAQR